VEIKTEVRNYITETFFASTPGTVLQDDTPLIARGLVDSIGMLGLVAFLERRFEIEFMPREIDMDNLDSINLIDELVRRKLAMRNANPRKHSALAGL